MSVVQAPTFRRNDFYGLTIQNGPFETTRSDIEKSTEMTNNGFYQLGVDNYSVVGSPFVSPYEFKDKGVPVKFLPQSIARRRLFNYVLEKEFLKKQKKKKNKVGTGIDPVVWHDVEKVVDKAANDPSEKQLMMETLASATQTELEQISDGTQTDMKKVLLSLGNVETLNIQPGMELMEHRPPATVSGTQTEIDSPGSMHGIKYLPPATVSGTQTFVPTRNTGTMSEVPSILGGRRRSDGSDGNQVSTRPRLDGSGGGFTFVPTRNTGTMSEVPSILGGRRRSDGSDGGQVSTRPRLDGSGGGFNPENIVPEVTEPSSPEPIRLLELPPFVPPQNEQVQQLVEYATNALNEPENTAFTDFLYTVEDLGYAAEDRMTQYTRGYDEGMDLSMDAIHYLPERYLQLDGQRRAWIREIENTLANPATPANTRTALIEQRDGLIQQLRANEERNAAARESMLRDRQVSAGSGVIPERRVVRNPPVASSSRSGVRPSPINTTMARRNPTRAARRSPIIESPSTQSTTSPRVSPYEPASSLRRNPPRAARRSPIIESPSTPSTTSPRVSPNEPASSLRRNPPRAARGRRVQFTADTVDPPPTNRPRRNRPRAARPKKSMKE